MADSDTDEQVLHHHTDGERRRRGNGARRHRRRHMRRHEDDPWDRLSCRTVIVSLLFAMLSIAGHILLPSATSVTNLAVPNAATSAMIDTGNCVVAQQFNQMTELSRRALTNQCPATISQFTGDNNKGKDSGNHFYMTHFDVEAIEGQAQRLAIAEQQVENDKCDLDPIINNKQLAEQQSGFCCF